MPYNPKSLQNLTPFKPGEQPQPGARYVEKMMERGHKMSPQAMSVIGRIMKDREIYDELIPLHLRLRAAEYIVDKTWPKLPAGMQMTIDGATSLEVHFNFPEGETKTLNGHTTISFDADGD